MGTKILKILLITITSLVLLLIAALFILGYMSQSDKGEMVIGGGTDGYNNYTQRGSFHHIEETVRALVETFPMIARLKMLHPWLTSSPWKA